MGVCRGLLSDYYLLHFHFKVIKLAEQNALACSRQAGTSANQPGPPQWERPLPKSRTALTDVFFTQDRLPAGNTYA